jgi:DNA invertase Pin-like site-specific DNA recombinase
MMEQRYVAYYRVSTKRQGDSGLGLDAQKAEVNRFINTKSGQLIAEYTEIESGKKNDRPKLEEAIEHTNREKATLIIAKLDRLARKAYFILFLRDSKVPFIACDIPEANTLNIGILATLAQHEQELISKRTKDALAIRKAQGKPIGIKGRENLIKSKAWIKSLEVRRAKTGKKWHSSKQRILALELRTKGISLGKIAKKLNEAGYRTSKGCLFQATTVLRLLR